MRVGVITILFTSMVNVLGTIAQDICSVLNDANWIWTASDTVNLKRTTVQLTFTKEGFELDTIFREMRIGDQNCMVSSSTGHLLFYSNGCYVANSFDRPVENGDSLNPGVVFNSLCKGREGDYLGVQSMFAVPSPVLNDSLFYLLHKSYEYFNVSNIYYTCVSPYGNNGEGAVLAKNVPIVIDTNVVSSNFTATKHANGKGWWILTHTAYGNGFYRILLDSSGFSVQDVQNIGGNTSPKNDAGQAKFSPDGSKFAMYHSKSGVYLFDFDRVTGLLSNYQSFGPIDSSMIIGGCEFSPSGRFLYVNTMEDVYQYDMNAVDIPASEVHLGHYDGHLSPFGTRFFQMERTPHGKILMNCPNQVNVLHVINEPNKKGHACDFKQHDIVLPAYIFWSMPHFPNYRLGPMNSPQCDTIVSAVHALSREDGFRVFPNPTTGHITLDTEINIGTPMIVEVVDIVGRLVFRKIVYSTPITLDLSSIPAATYWILIRNDSEVLFLESIVIGK